MPVWSPSFHISIGDIVCLKELKTIDELNQTFTTLSRSTIMNAAKNDLAIAPWSNTGMQSPHKLTGFIYIVYLTRVGPYDPVLKVSSHQGQDRVGGKHGTDFHLRRRLPST
jgi:hypothetical protein